MVMNNLHERAWKETVMAHLQILSHNLFGGEMRKTMISHSQDNQLFKMDTSKLKGRDAIYYTLADTDH